MRVLVLHNEVSSTAGADEKDVLDQAALVEEGLRALEHEVEIRAVSLDLSSLRSDLQRRRPDLVFNLVESLAGSDRLILAVPGLLETLGVPFTGAPLEALLATTNKVLAKRLLRATGVRTPDDSEQPGLAKLLERSARVVVKSRWSHGSLDLEADSVLSAAERGAIRSRLAERPGDRFAEAYVHGREFNLSLLAAPGGAEVLPPAEIRFEGSFAGAPADAPRVVGYRAKWALDSDEYRDTPRSFAFAPADAELLERLREAALACWREFGLRGYARVDFRVDAAGEPLVLEVNANPCLAPDAGFVAACGQAGLAVPELLRRIVDDALGEGA